MIKLKPKIDLRYYNNTKQQQLKGNNLIIDVLSKLIEQTNLLLLDSTDNDKKKNQFRVAQFKKAVASIKASQTEITNGQQAQALPGIGAKIAARIDEILKTGTLAELNENKKLTPKELIIQQLLTVTGIGESHAKKFVEMGVISVQDLQEKTQKGLIKVTHHMEIGLKYYLEFQQKIQFQEIAELKQDLIGCVHNLYPDIIVEICGSHRRQRPLSGDIDVLMTVPYILTDDDLINSRTHYLKDIVQALKNTNFIIDDLTSKGDTKYMGVCIHPINQIARRIDIRFVSYDSFYPALLYFTGSMMLNKLMRTIALEKGYTLNEYGIYTLVSGSKSNRLVVHSEKEIFDLLGLLYLEPKDREINM